MHEIDLANLDLNLLVVFDVLMDERQVTRAAKRLHRTQSATSHALARLREQLDDPILVRVGGEMRPTPRAQRLAPEIRRILGEVRSALRAQPTFDPARSDRRFSIVGADFVAACLVPLLATFERKAPGVSVELVSPRRSMADDVAAGRHDLAIAPPPEGTLPGITVRSFASLEWVVFARRGHPAVRTWGYEAWLAHRHVRIRTTSSGPGPVDEALGDDASRRRAGPTLPHFLLAPALLAQSDLLLTVPKAVLAGVAPKFRLVALPVPLELDPVELSVWIGTRFSAQPGLVWFEQQLQRAAEGLWV